MYAFLKSNTSYFFCYVIYLIASLYNMSYAFYTRTLCNFLRYRYLFNTLCSRIDDLCWTSFYIACFFL